MILIHVLCFRGPLQAYSENMFMAFKRYLYLSMYFDREIKSVRSIFQKFINILQYYDCAGISLEELCAVCTCSDMTTTLKYAVFIFTGFYYLCNRTEHCWIF